MASVASRLLIFEFMSSLKGVLGVTYFVMCSSDVLQQHEPTEDLQGWIFKSFVGFSRDLSVGCGSFKRGAVCWDLKHSDIWNIFGDQNVCGLERRADISMLSQIIDKCQRLWCGTRVIHLGFHFICYWIVIHLGITCKGEANFQDSRWSVGCSVKGEILSR